MTAERSLYELLKASCPDAWDAYVNHAFVRDLAAGTLPKACFQHYLIQDFKFLIHWSRAFGLAAYKAESLADIRMAAEGWQNIVDEMALHVDLCGRWGVSENDMERAPESTACMAYTRFVLEAGLRGDLLDLFVAMAPCIAGYAEIGWAAKALVPERALPDHPYREWIEAYAGDDFQQAARSHVLAMDAVLSTRGGPGRWNGLTKLFREATVLEAGFWQMGLDRSF